MLPLSCRSKVLRHDNTKKYILIFLYYSYLNRTFALGIFKLTQTESKNSCVYILMCETGNRSPNVATVANAQSTIWNLLQL